MTWSILYVLTLALGLAILGIRHHRAGLRALRATLAEREEARACGSDRAQLQYPVVDLSRCLGCGTCVRACPEEGVLGLVHGQATVVHGARCVGHGLCAEACPVDAISVTLGDLSARSDIPVVSERLEADGVPGLFLAGEVTGYALVRTAITHGAAVAEEVAGRAHAATAPRTAAATGGARRTGRGPVPAPASRPGTAVLDADAAEPLDLCIVGAGPAGLSCALAAQERGLEFVVLERDTIGGTVAKYPRRKLVLTQPVELPVYGRLRKLSYRKEELMRIWEGIARERRLPVLTGEEFLGLQRDRDGVFSVRGTTRTVRARNVCLCLGRRGSPRRLGVPGEDLPKVVYSLIDAESYRGRRILVVGGGDSAVEAAIALTEQPGNRVTLSYRKSAFFRIKAKNRSRLEERVAAGAIDVRFGSEVVEVRQDRVLLAVDSGGPPVALPNDDVFVLAGGIPPFDLLGNCGVSFDGSKRQPPEEHGDRGTGILRALVWGQLLTLVTLCWCYLFRDYYTLSWTDRPDSEWHRFLEPTGVVGMTAGALATLLIVLNLLYVIRRSRLGRFIAGSLQNWLSLHVVTGLLALLFLIVHGGMMIRDTAGGLALVAVVILVVSGAIGRYFYAWLPKAANGRELAHAEAKAALAATVADLDRDGRGLGPHLRRELDDLMVHEPWGRTLPRRISALVGARWRLRSRVARLRGAAIRQGLGPVKVRELAALARGLHRSSMMAGHYHDLRELVGSWRFLHRWLALAMVLLAANHIAVGLRYARFW